VVVLCHPFPAGASPLSGERRRMGRPTGCGRFFKGRAIEPSARLNCDPATSSRAIQPGPSWPLPSKRNARCRLEVTGRCNGLAAGATSGRPGAAPGSSLPRPLGSSRDEGGSGGWKDGEADQEPDPAPGPSAKQAGAQGLDPQTSTARTRANACNNGQRHGPRRWNSGGG